MHQPEVPIPDESSTEMAMAGGTLTSQPLTKFLFSPNEELFNVDQLIQLPFYSRQFNFSPSSVMFSSLLAYDPFQTLAIVANANAPIPWPIVYLRSCQFYDFDINIVFLAIKHERSRGRLQISWTPSSVNGVIPEVNTTGIHTRSMKWIWDLEHSDSFAIDLVGTKHMAWRDRRLMNVAIPASSTYMVVGSNVGTMNNFNVGQLDVRVLDPYSAGLLGPDICPIVVFTQILNVATAEYRPPFGGKADEEPYYATA